MPLDDNTRAFLSEKRFAVLATINASGTPQQTVMWYDLRGDTLLMNTTLTRLKGRNLRRDTRISVCIADGYQFVTITGEAQLNDDPATAQADIRDLAIRYHGQEEGERRSREIYAPQQRVTISLPIAHVFVYGFPGQ